jgi:hypothetical protein
MANRAHIVGDTLSMQRGLVALCKLVDLDISTDLREAFLECRTKCCLRARENVKTGKVYADWVRKQSDAFRTEGVTRLVAGLAPHKYVFRNPPDYFPESCRLDLLPRDTMPGCDQPTAIGI